MYSKLPTPSRTCFPQTRLRRRYSRVSAATPGTSLQRLKLGASDLTVSEVCLGCMMFGSQNSETESHAILDAAFDRGVNFLDTSEYYSVPPRPETSGLSSEYIGSWLKQRRVKREDIVSATKAIGYAPAEGNGFIGGARTVPPSGPMEVHLDAKSIEDAVDAELRRLGVDYIDLMQTHWPDRYVPYFGYVHYNPNKERDSVSFEEQVRAMGDMIQKGKIRYWGLSNETSYGTTMICVTADRLNCPRPVTIQNSYSLVDRNFEGQLAEVCCKRHLSIPLLPWSAAAGGVLSGKYLHGQFPEGSRMGRWGGRYERFLSDRMSRATEEYVKIANRFGWTPIQLAYLFCKSRYFVGSTLIGATNLEQLDENLSCFSGDLSVEALEAIDEVHSNNPNPQNVYS